MTPEQADILTERVVGHFQMCGRYLNEEAQLAYGELFQRHDYKLVSEIVSSVVRTSDEPRSVAWYANAIRERMPKAPLRLDKVPGAEFSEETRRRTFREAMKHGLCDEKGEPKNDFARMILRKWENEEQAS